MGKIKELLLESKYSGILLFLIIIAFLTLIAHFIPEDFFAGLGNVISITDVLTFFFAFLAWETARKNLRMLNKKTVEHEYKEKTNAALFVTSGPVSGVENMKNFLLKAGNGDSEYNKKILDITQGEFFEGIEEDKLKVLADGRIEYAHEFYREKIIHVYFLKNDDLGRMIQIHFDKMPSDEDKLHEFLHKYDEVIEEISGILASNGVENIHVFTKSTLEIPYLIQNHFCNSFIVEIYHWEQGDKYVYAGQLVKKDYRA